MTTWLSVFSGTFLPSISTYTTVHAPSIFWGADFHGGGCLALSWSMTWPWTTRAQAKAAANDAACMVFSSRGWGVDVIADPGPAVSDVQPLVPLGRTAASAVVRRIVDRIPGTPLHRGAGCHIHQGARFG